MQGGRYPLSLFAFKPLGQAARRDARRRSGKWLNERCSRRLCRTVADHENGGLRSLPHARTARDRHGDTSFRRIDASLTTADLAYDDAHYDHACVDRDLNCVFPVDRLAALAREGRIAGMTAEHFSMGYSQALRELRETTVPQIARAGSAARPDAVLLTGG